jgi:hypothetical protein
MAKKSNWFEVSKEGLAKLMQRKGKAFIVYELLQNSWDQNVTQVELWINTIKNTPRVMITIRDDDPKGFSDLSHAFTLFAESEKKSDPSKRGRFNLGEKLVLAISDGATIKSTTGSIFFDKNGMRRNNKIRTEKGSYIDILVKMTRAEFSEVCDAVYKVIPPQGIVTTFNDVKLEQRVPLASFTIPLPTEISDENGNLKKTIRKTVVNIYEPKEGEIPSIYEMGIPVVELEGDKYHIDVQQKVPLNMDRDNVTPKYLKTIRTEVFNRTFNLLDTEEINSTWVKEATSNENCSDDAIITSLDMRFGKKRVIFDPSDPEANKKAVSEGYAVIPGKSLSKQEWANVKRCGAALPAGQVTPSHKIKSSPDGEPPIPFDSLSEKQQQVLRFAGKLACELIGDFIKVQAIRLPSERAVAWYGTSTGLTFNISRLKKSFFEDFPNNIEEVIDLCIHEFGHEYSKDHLSEEYYRALTSLGARCTMLAIRNPKFFN